jgi:divalent metal cation (Fe/Co/Zn/Cd) transporter
MHITVDGKMSVEEADDLSFKVAEKLKREIPEIGYVMVHVCPHFRHSKRYLVEN